MTMWKKSAILSQIIKDWCRDIQEKVANMSPNAYVVLTPIWADRSADTSAYNRPISRTLAKRRGRGSPRCIGATLKVPQDWGIRGLIETISAVSTL